MRLDFFYQNIASLTELTASEVEEYVLKMTSGVRERHSYCLEGQVRLYPQELTRIFVEAIEAARQGKDLSD